MAINSVILDMVLQMAKSLGKPCRMVCLGYPDMLVTEQQLISLCGPRVLEQIAFREDSASILRWHSIDGETSRLAETRSVFHAMEIYSDFVDIVASRGFEIVLDLNQPLASELIGKYDIVYDGGTMEHCFNVGQVMRNITAFARIGGIIVHVNPLNYYNHGFFNFSPTFYHDYYTQSGHRMASDFYALYGPVFGSKTVKLPATVGFNAPERSVLMVAAQKLHDRQPDWPTQSKYLNNSALKG
jgi:hypothetical protein